MKTEYIFSEPLLVAKRDLDSEAVTNDVLSLIDKGHESARKSGKELGKRINLFPELFEQIDLPHLKEVIDSIVHMIDQYRLSINMKKLDMSAIWINLNGRGGYNERHAHPGSIISGVFYVKVPDDSESPFLLFKSRESTDYGFSDAFINDNSPQEMYSSMVIPAEEGKMILFPSYIDHEVPPNKSEDYRISISFNTVLANESS